MSAHAVIVIDPATGKLVMGASFNARTAQEALTGFCLEKGIAESKVPDAIVLLGLTGSTLLHKSAGKASLRRSRSRQELEAAFDLVKPRDNWKKPIRRVLVGPSEEVLAAIGEAVPYFTGGAASFEELRGGKVRVTADGYYACTGA